VASRRRLHHVRLATRGGPGHQCIAPLRPHRNDGQLEGAVGRLVPDRNYRQVILPSPVRIGTAAAAGLVVLPKYWISRLGRRSRRSPRIALAGEQQFTSAACTVNVKLPELVGVPETTPVEPRSRKAAGKAPLLIIELYGPVPPWP